LLYQTSQFEAALQSWQQSLSLYRASQDLRRQGAALGNLGAGYQAFGILWLSKALGHSEATKRDDKGMEQFLRMVWAIALQHYELTVTSGLS